MKNLRGGGIELQLFGDNELALIILSCIVYNKQYLVKNPKIIKLVFGSVKEKVKNKFLTLTLNLVHLLALKLLDGDRSLIAKIRTSLVSSNNRIRLLVRLIRATIIRFVDSGFLLIPSAILMMLIYITI